jgi:hypothetical protein
LNKGFSGSHEAGGILGTSVHPHLIVQVNAGRSTGGTHGADPLGQTNVLTGADSHGVEMGVAGLEAATMIYLNGVSIA